MPLINRTFTSLFLFQTKLNRTNQASCNRTPTPTTTSTSFEPVRSDSQLFIYGMRPGTGCECNVSHILSSPPFSHWLRKRKGAHTQCSNDHTCKHARPLFSPSRSGSKAIEEGGREREIWKATQNPIFALKNVRFTRHCPFSLSLGRCFMQRGYYAPADRLTI